MTFLESTKHSQSRFRDIFYHVVGKLNYSSPLDSKLWVCFFWHQRPANQPQCIAQLFLPSILVRRWWKLALLHPVLWFLHPGRGKATFHRKAKWWNRGEVIYTLISSTDLILNQWFVFREIHGIFTYFPNLNGKIPNPRSISGGFGPFSSQVGYSPSTGMRCFWSHSGSVAPHSATLPEAPWATATWSST